jgi:hypothetical protein
VWTFRELYMQGLRLKQQADLMKNVQFFDAAKTRMYVDPSIVGRDSDGISRYNKFQGHGFRSMILGKNDRVEGWATMDDMLEYEAEETLDDGFQILTPPQWRIHSECVNLIKFLTDAPRDEKNMEDVADDFSEDHSGDSNRYFLHSHFGKKVRRAAPRDEFSIGFRLEQLQKNARRTAERPFNWN